ncbi:MAG: MFS transporter [Chloroflexi bacterium]|nr:MFS transporter [Chloroflexota bacterium]
MWPFYLGGFMGPFGYGTVLVILPLIAVDFGTDIQQATLTISSYMGPYAVGLLFSGTIADLFGLRRVVVTGLAGFAIASLAAALAPTIELFLAARVAQGLSNAFMTSLIMTSIADMVTPAQIGKTVGTFSAFVTAGQFLAPPLSGTLSLVNWRLVYLLITAVATGLALHYWRLYGAAGIGLHARGSTNPITIYRRVLGLKLLLLCFGTFVGSLTTNAINFLFALHLHDRWGLNPAVSGVILSLAAIVNICVASWAGGLGDRIGSVRVALMGTAMTIVLFVALALVDTLPIFVVLYAMLGVGISFIWTALSTLVVTGFPAQRGAATSICNAFRFLAIATAPTIYAPFYLGYGAHAALLAAAAFTALLVVNLTWYAALAGASARRSGP